MRLRLAPLVALIALVPLSARAEQSVGLGAWFALSPRSGVASFTAVQMHVRFPLGEYVSFRPGFRYAPPFSLTGEILGGDGAQIARASQLTLEAPFLAGYERGRVRVEAGAGFTYHLRFVQTLDAAHAYQAVPGAPQLGSVARLDLVDHPGIDLLADISVLLAKGIRLAVGGGYSRAATRLLATPAADSSFEVSHDFSLGGWHVEAWLSWDFPR